jgi:4-diphosphocytidyl-2-C-methyl-D-erythritol kinase
MKIFASAKLNLCLDILEKTPSGYHKIQTVLYEWKSLQNEIEIKETKKEQNNPITLAHQAYEFLKKRHRIKENFSIDIKRNIPFSSGLGGESSNAASILKYFNKLWGLGLSINELKKIATKFGMDTPFFIEGGVAFGKNFGEEVSPLPVIDLPLKVFAKSSLLKEKTKTAYSTIDLKLCGKNTEKTQKAVSAIKKGNIASLILNFHNDFETLTPTKNAQHLTGAGPSYFKIQ